MRTTLVCLFLVVASCSPLNSQEAPPSEELARPATAESDESKPLAVRDGAIRNLGPTPREPRRYIDSSSDDQIRDEPYSTRVAERFISAEPTQHEHKKVIDKAFLTMSGMYFAASIADVERTAHCLESKDCIELNPILGPHPSRAKAYGFSLGFSIPGHLIAYYLKKKGTKWWLVPFIGGTVCHTIGATASF